MKKITLILLFVTLGFLYTLPAKAISPTPTASPSVTPTLSGNLEDKIQEIREEVKKKVREKIEEIKKGTKAAYAGEIINISDLTLTLNAPTGERKVQIATDTAIISLGGRKVTPPDLKVGNFILAMGYLGDNNLLEAKRIVVANKPKLVIREVAFGKVTDISSDEKIITVKNEKRNLLYTIEVTDKTIITKKIDGSVKKVKFADIAIGDRLVAIGTPTENEEKIIVAKLIHVIPGLSKPTKSPTPTSQE